MMMRVMYTLFLNFPWIATQPTHTHTHMSFLVCSYKIHDLFVRRRKQDIYLLTHVVTMRRPNSVAQLYIAIQLAQMDLKKFNKKPRKYYIPIWPQTLITDLKVFFFHASCRQNRKTVSLNFEIFPYYFP